MKIFVYDNAKFPVHDSIPEYAGFVPFSKLNIDKKYEIVKIAEEADCFYMGQFSCLGEPFIKEKFEYFEKYPDKHICDLEGDWTHNYAPKEILQNCIITTNGAKKEYSQSYDRIFIRPTFSKLLVNLVRNYKRIDYRPVYNRTFAFKGFQDPFGIRLRMDNLLSRANLNKDIEFNNSWSGNTAHTNPIVSDYMRKIYKNTFSLCPRGAGVDTVRFFESCYFGRIPVVVADNLLFGERDFKKPFFFKIDPALSDEQIIDKLKQISSIEQSVIDEMSNSCLDFFEQNVMSYFNDPDKCFYEWNQNRTSK